MDEVYEKILGSIEKDRVSGEFLAKITGKSRVAIWKRIKKLENLGYKIDHSPEGYKLLENSPYLLPYEIKKYLKTKKIGKNYIFFEEITSTNIYAKDRDFTDGTVILAENQISGKGRKGRKWISSKGKGLYFTVVLKRNFPVKDILKLSLLFPYAVRESIQPFLKNKILIKWPNDLYINNRKFAGFLIETEIEGNEVSRVIAGIGININNDKKEFKGLQNKATSLKIEENNLFDRKILLAHILKNIEDHIENFEKIDFCKEIDKYLLWKGEKVYIPDESTAGILLGLDQTGGLKILTDNGKKVIYSGDLSLRRIV
ncbi:biotin--[acetyl-CoA-carboxylase] ligase [Persephonella sp.]